jgi:type IV pilus assembly protein PilY1
VNGILNFPDDFERLQAGTLEWPDLVNNHPSAVDDLWHAAVNSRGRYLSASDPAEFASALSGILREIVDREGSEGGVAAAAATLQAGNRKYVPTYRTAQWNGNLTAYTLDENGQQLSAVWNAEGALPAFGSRNIYVGTRNGDPRAVSFNWADLPAAMQAELGANGSASLVNFLRGDRSLEGTTYRRRGGRLGDIVNSQPTFVGGLVDLRYQTLPAGTPGRDSYRDFVTAKRAREGVVFVGANDGMLHGFRDTTGSEVFAFIPRALLSAMPALASPSYEHRYFVDGQQVESDVYISGAWRNVLVGSAGAGARAIYALNVTNSSTMNASSVMWEFDSTVNAELGYVMQPIEVGLMANGTWAAIFGNGPDSASGNARLFVVNIATGEVIANIQAGTSTNNGLGGVRVIRNANQVIVGAYAGDLQGNVWKFDLASSSASSWRVAFSGNPLFTARDDSHNPRPISAPPAYLPHPNGGVMVMVGTGKLYEERDQTDNQSQALYGLWDQQALSVDADGNMSWSTATRITDASSIVEQAFSETTVAGAGGATFYTVTSQPLNWQTHRGWELPLSLAPGHRNLIVPQVVGGFIRFETMAPSDTGIVNPCDDTSGGVGYNIILNPLSGSMPTQALYDVNGDGVINSSDTVVAGVRTNWDGRDVILREPPCVGAGCRNDPTPCPSGTIRFVTAGASGGGTTNVCVPVPPSQRWWWRQLFQQ